MKTSYQILLLATVFVLAFSSRVYVVNASAMTEGLTSTITVTVNCCGASVSGNTFANQGPSGHFWTVWNGAGIKGGNPTNEPMSFYFAISDSVGSGIRTGYADAKANWLGDGVNTEGSMSGYLGGTITNSYTVTNDDPTYARGYYWYYNSYYE